MDRQNRELSGSDGENCISHLGEGDKTRLAVEMPAACYDVERGFQTGRHVLRAGQWNIGIILPRPATGCPTLSAANGSPVKRCVEKRVIDRVIVGKTERTDESCCQKKTGNRFDSLLNQAERERGA